VAKLTIKLLLFLPIIGTLVGLNYYCDPANLFQSYDYERGIAAILLEGKNVANVKNFDERALQRLYISALKAPKDIVVLGSSRSLGIGAWLFPDKTFFNSSVAGATIEDYAAIYQLYRKNGLVPKILIIGVDPWVLNRYNDQPRWRSLAPEYNEIAKILVPGKRYFESDSTLQKYAELFSPGYFKASVRVLISRVFSPKKEQSGYFGTTDHSSDYSLKLSDGSLSYDKKGRMVTADEARRLAISYAMQSPVYSLGNFDKLDKDYMKKLEALIDLATRDKVTVIFFLPPYHPKTYALLNESGKYPGITAAEHYFAALGAAKKIKVLGSYDPAKCSMDETDFYDGMHVKNESLGKIFNR
jgi:hypothetical protein